ncbi:TatD DNase family protein [Muriicola jejuensis]|uniref:YchF/TatD family DNA exonuclease n=1 Tax=Muriicola jejuensis TaxID=504488 RepID=A0A6P0UAE9_9FLAO|nr:TatD family hydrolase [Muriicola jejuensis]NER09552.1 YchF/TatD family DNA exonuclease [Muriicola jejuensis]SMP07769.1 TatD DNase family protein [Muriicola jejuensis]
MLITDTHIHLYSESFEEDRAQVVKKALANGIERFFVPAIDSEYTDSMFRLEKDFPGKIFLMAGLHPTHVKENYREELDHVRNLLSQRKFWAVGEIGIDLYWDKTFFPEQRLAFKEQIALAKEYGLPIVIHCRESFDEIFEVLEEEKGDDLYGIFHCFTGTLEQAERAIGFNMKLGIGGVVTFKNGKIDRFLDRIGLEHLVLETDAPYLAPVPHRGKRNEPSFLMEVLNKLSDIYGVREEEIARITTENSRQVFGV